MNLAGAGQTNAVSPRGHEPYPLRITKETSDRGLDRM